MLTLLLLIRLAGKLKGLYIRTAKNVLISVNPKIRLPRTFKRFCGLIVQLLQKLSIRATNGPDKLMRVVKGPVTKYFPVRLRPGFKLCGTVGRGLLLDAAHPFACLK